MKNSILFNKLIFFIGYAYFKITGKNNHYSYIAFRRLFYITGGRFNDTFSKKCLDSGTKTDYDLSKSILKDLTSKKVAYISNKIVENGYYLFENLVDELVCDKLIGLAQNAKCTLLPNPTNLNDRTVDLINPEAIKYRINEQDLLKNFEVQNLMVDDGFLVIAQKYLRTIPIIDFVTMWWSFPSDRPSNQIAQMYHCDMDRLKFLIFFIYLTDVDDNNRPHCYVKKSHKDLPKHLRADRRYSDEEIIDIYPKENRIEFKGKKGSLIAIDTRGIHKGKFLKENHRLIFQLEYTNSLFGSIDLIRDQRISFNSNILDKSSKSHKTFSRKILRNNIG